MSKMTRKQVTALVENPESWEIIPGNEYVRTAKLEIFGETYLRYDEWTLVNFFESRVRKTEPERMDWDTLCYRSVHKGMVHPVSKTTMCNEIYELSQVKK